MKATPAIKSAGNWGSSVASLFIFLPGASLSREHLLVLRFFYTFLS
jgi:hypothetical protein